MKRGFDLSLLPTAHQDAVVLYRAINVRWIWIDCLCILQDSIEDFQTEAGLMHKVYSNSFCNHSATGGVDNNESLLVHRNPENMQPPQVLSTLGGREQAFHILHESMWRHPVPHAPVNQRGWVLQERSLSSRVLHFGKQQVFWECRESMASELFPDGFPSEMDLMTKSKFNGLFALGEPLYWENADSHHEDPAFSRRLAQRAWNRALEAYSECKLTEPGDVITAFNGVAAQMHSRTLDEYYAGLWRSSLLQDLLWHYAAGAVAKGQPEKGRAPSWSWALVEALPTAALSFFPSHAPGGFGACRLLRVDVVPVSKANTL
jgi:hypothetical protein